MMIHVIYPKESNDRSDTPTHPHQKGVKWKKKKKGNKGKNQSKTSPSEARCLRKRGAARGLVKISAGISEVGIQCVEKNKVVTNVNVTI